jgi:NADH-quinone oxidoreductase subunit J
MQGVFYISGAIAVVATLLMLTRLNAIHALLYLVVSLLAIAIVFYTLGAALAAALEVIVYAGAIMVLFVFVVMLLNLGEKAIELEKHLLTPRIWTGPAILVVILAAEFIFILIQGSGASGGPVAVDPKQVAAALYVPYVIGAELASMLLLAGLVGAYHLGRQPSSRKEGKQWT